MMKHQTAQSIATKIKDQLAPFCERIEIAGSIRRQKRENIKDVEILCIPKTELQRQSLFGDEIPIRHPEFIKVLQQWERLKGNTQTGKYIQMHTYPIPGEERSRAKLDLFIATRENWGYQLAIRTGSVKFSKIIASTWKKAGLQGRNGMLYWIRSNAPQPIFEEAELFQLLNLKYIKPENRELI